MGLNTWMTAVTAQIHSVNPSEIMWVIHRLKIIIADDLSNANPVCLWVYGFYKGVMQRLGAVQYSLIA